jgi:hypothetical protein
LVVGQRAEVFIGHPAFSWCHKISHSWERQDMIIRPEPVINE